MKRTLVILMVLWALGNTATARAQSAAGDRRAPTANPQAITEYYKLEQRLGVAKNDPTTAFAVFIMGCYVAYSGAPVPAQDKLVNLSGQVAAHADKLMRQAGSQRQQVTEYLATTGMSFVLQRMALERRPDPRAKAALRAEAESVLAQMKVDPTTLVTSFGKVLQPDGHAPAPAADPPQAPKPQAPATANARGPDLAALRRQVVGITTSYHRRYSGEYVDWVQRFHLLLKSGWATQKLKAALEPGGLDAHRAKHPKEWVRWRRSAKGVDLCEERCNDPRQWHPLPSEMAGGYIAPLLPKGHRFAGSFKSVSGGSVGDTTALSYGFWTFEANGRFSTSSAGSVSVNSWRPSTGTRQIASGGRTSESVGGTYEIDGFIVTLRFDDGRVLYRLFDADRKRNPGSVTIDGTMHTRME